MKRLLFSLISLLPLSDPALGAKVWLSLNLEFNIPNDFDSGGQWTAVAKTDERGLAAVVLAFDATSLNFDPATGFLVPPEFSNRFSGIRLGQLEIVTAFDLASNPAPTFDVGVIGGSFSSMYVDHPGLSTFGSNTDLGSFSGGAELATGSFNPGYLPIWSTSEIITTGASVFMEGVSLPQIATVFTTVRYVVPEPATMLLAGFSLIGLTRRNGNGIWVRSALSKTSVC